MALRVGSAAPSKIVHRILIADDDVQVLRLFERILTNCGYAVFTASSGTDALNVIEACRIDLLVLDLSMPEPDGFELLKSLRSKKPDLMILVISGYLPEVLLDAAEVLGASASLSKTLAPKLLARTVERLLHRKPARVP